MANMKLLNQSASHVRTRALSCFIAVLALSLLLASCSSSINKKTSPSAKSERKYTIDLSNNYLGNAWRVQMEKSAEAATKYGPLAGHVKLSIVNAGDTISDQVASLDSMIAAHPDAIIVDASSATALNSAIANACRAGIVVVNFDQQTTASCAYHVFVSYYDIGLLDAQWMANILHGHGNVYEDYGLPGSPISAEELQAWKKVLAKYPGIHVVGYFTSKYELGLEQSGVASLLATHPNVQGILDQSQYCTGALKALADAGHAPVPMQCNSYNGTMIKLAETPGAESVISVNPPWLSSDAVKIAVSVLEHHTAQRIEQLPLECYYVGKAAKIAIPSQYHCSKVVVGKNAFPADSPGLDLPVSPPWAQFPISAVNP